VGNEMDRLIRVCQGMKISVLAFLVLSAVAPIVSAQNYKRVEGYSEERRLRTMQTFINSASFPCAKATYAFFKGHDRAEAGYWYTTCSDGGNFIVQIADDANGSVTILECGTYERVTRERCSAKF